MMIKDDVATKDAEIASTKEELLESHEEVSVFAIRGMY